MRRVVFITGIAVASLLVSACGAGTSNREKPAVLKEFTPTLIVSKMWEGGAGDRSPQDNHLRPVIVAESSGRHAYSVSPRGKVFAFEALTGKTVWQVALKLPVSAGLAADDKQLYLGTREGEIIALDKSRGTIRWRTPVSSEILAAPAVTADGSMVIVQTVDGNVHAVDGVSGTKRWTYQGLEHALSLRGTASPAIYQNIVITGLADGKISIINLATGKKVGEYVVAQPSGRTELERMVDVDGTPVLSGEMLYAVSFQGRLVAVNLRSGKLEWSRNLSAYRSMAVDGRALYIVDADSALLAVDRQSGKPLWRQEGLRARELSAPALMGDYVIVGDYDGYLHVLAKSNGDFAARIKLGNSSISARPDIVAGIVYVLDHGGRLRALRLAAR